MGNKTGNLVDKLTDKNEQLSLREPPFVGESDLKEKLKEAKKRITENISWRLNDTTIQQNGEELVNNLMEYIIMAKSDNRPIEGDIFRFHFVVHETKPLNIEIRLNDLMGTNEYNANSSTLYIKGTDIFCEYVETCIVGGMFQHNDQAYPLQITKKTYVSDEDINEYMEIKPQGEIDDNVLHEIIQLIATQLGYDVHENEIVKMNAENLTSLGKISEFKLTHYIKTPSTDIASLKTKQSKFKERALKLSSCLVKAYQNYHDLTKGQKK